MDARVELGPFLVEEEIGTGGMGAVYRARHAETGEPVALKALLADVAREPVKLRNFRREVQALAKLHHPTIAAILDYGQIGSRAASRGPEPFVEGAPWFAMEYVDGRPLSKRVGDWDWRSLRAVVLSVLDALAHAHARSIVHRDLKPENILAVSPSDSGARTVKLVDFGVAHLFGPESGERAEQGPRVSGTPKYMAPEQILGRERDQGPWTDLYALGCLIWRLVCGRAPFDGSTVEEILQSQLEEPPAPFGAQIPVPAGFEGWLRGLMDKDIDRRTRRAADAASGLLALGGPGDGAPRERDDEGEPVGEPTVETTRATLDPNSLEAGDTVVETPDSSVTVDTAPSETTPEPEGETGEAAVRGTPPSELPDWRRKNPARKAAVLPGAGLELFGLREVPVVDRNQERDELWEALRAVRRTGEPRMIALLGGPGTGKTRLAEWICRRAHEVGAARVLRGTHAPTSEPDEGLREMVQRTFRTDGLSRGDVFERLRRRLPSTGRDDLRISDARALTEFLRPTPEGAERVEGPRYQFASSAQKFGLIRRLLVRLSARRSLVVWFDDLQWGRMALAVIEELFETVAEPPPVLVVGTIRSDLVAEDDRLRDEIDRGLATAGARRVELEALPAAEHRAFIDRLLDLDPELADRLAERTEGHPLFALQLLRSWVERGVLEETDAGFCLPDGTRPELPADIHELWMERLRRVVQDVGTAEEGRMWRVLEIAAALGREVDGQEWRTLGDEFGLESPSHLLGLLVDRGLAERRAEGWAFAHNLLADSLRRRARDGGRWREHNRLCARLVERLHPERAEHTAGRRAEYYIEAGDLEEALEPLLVEAKRAYRTGYPDRPGQLYERRRQLLDQLDVEPSDPRRLENTVNHGRYHLKVGSDPVAIRERLEEARRLAEREGHHDLAAEAALEAGRTARVTKEYDRAAQYYDEALRSGRETDNDELQARVLRAHGWLAYLRGDLDEAEQYLVEARDRAEEAGARYGRASIRSDLAWVAVSLGEEGRARELFEEVIEFSRESGNRLEGHCLNGLGELARFAGNVDEARSRYRAFRKRTREKNRPANTASADVNLAQVELMAGRFERARSRLDRADALFREIGRERSLYHVRRFSRLAHAAGIGDQSAFDRIFADYSSEDFAGASLLKDHPWLVEMAGDFAAERGAETRARRAWRLARRLWEELEDEEARERVDRKLRDGNSSDHVE